MGPFGLEQVFARVVIFNKVNPVRSQHLYLFVCVILRPNYLFQKKKEKSCVS